MSTSSIMQQIERQMRRKEGLVHLQFVGDLPGTPAHDLTVGDLLMWNGGAIYEVTSVREVSPQFIEIRERAEARPMVNEYTRRLKKDRLVVRVCRECKRASKHRPSCTLAGAR